MLLGEEHPDTINAMVNLSSILCDKGKLDATEPLAKAALAGCRRVLGDAAPPSARPLSPACA